MKRFFFLQIESKQKCKVWCKEIIGWKESYPDQFLQGLPSATKEYRRLLWSGSATQAPAISSIWTRGAGVHRARQNFPWRINNVTLFAKKLSINLHTHRTQPFTKKATLYTQRNRLLCVSTFCVSTKHRIQVFCVF